jgi:hypothetical protein
VSKNLLEFAIEEDVLPIKLAEEYLKIYVADIEWSSHIKKLWKNFLNKNKTEEECKSLVKRAISCTILLPATENTQIPNPPHSLLFWCTGWVQFHEKDWFDSFKKVVVNDIQIRKKRMNLINIGIIDPIDHSPVTRQAFNWMYDEAINNDCVKEENKTAITNKLKNIVSIYGGAVVSSMFMNHQGNIKNVLNWRSGYFFEKQIHKVYTIEKLIKIKNSEFAKTNPSYIKQVPVKPYLN